MPNSGREGRAASPSAAGDVLCIGEILWDALPDGLFLGGAPFNVAYHLHVLGKRTRIVSRVGTDVLGEEIVRRVRHRGMDADLIQVDPVRPTGFVRVELASTGEPRYEIMEPAAWDAIEPSPGLLQSAREAAAVVFGSLAQRNPVTASTLRQVCRTDALKVFDVNLRPPYDRREIVEHSLRLADLVKLNEAELHQIGGWFGLPSEIRESAQAVAQMFGCRMVCVTKGARGSALLDGSEWFEEPGLRVEALDTVGAGDAFLAGLLAGILDGREPQTVLGKASRLAAYTATRRGATPEYTQADVDRFTSRAAATARR